MTNTYPTKAAMRRNKRTLPQASRRGGIWCRARQGTVLTNHRFLYRGYLQIAVLDLTRSTLNELWFITWDPTEPVATRPLAIQKDGTWYTYGLDLPKNITEVYGTDGTIKTAYTYTPYGQVTASGSTVQSPRGLGGGLDKPEGFAPQGRAADGAAVSQPIQWSSEYADTDLALVYYNYRHYNPLDGRWTGRDKLEEADHFNVYGYVKNLPVGHYDIYGNGLLAWMGLIAVISLFTCALRAAVKAVEYSYIDKRQHCYTTCYMANYCGGKLPATLIATLKEVLDASYALIQRDFGIISGERYKNIIVDSINDYYADVKCINAESEEECRCCCKNV